MRATLSRAVVSSSGISPQRFRGVSTHRVNEDPETEAERLYLAQSLRGRFGEVAALAKLDGPRRVYREMEGEQILSRRVTVACYRLLAPGEAVSRGPRLLPRMSPIAGQAAHYAVELQTVAAIAEADGVIDDTECSEIEELEGKIVAATGSVRMTARVANGKQLAEEAKR